MNLFNKGKTIVYFEDRQCYVISYEENGAVGETHSFDIPINVVTDGEICDGAQLHYLLKKTLEELGLTKSKAFFVIHSTGAVNRTMHVPSMTEKERVSLIENESESLFAQDLEGYALESVDLKSDDDVHHLLVTVCPETIVEGYRDLAKQCELKLLGIIPFSTLALEYAHWLGGGRMNFVGTDHVGFYYGHENRYYDRTEANDSVLGFMSRNELMPEEILRIERNEYDGRISDIDRPNLIREMQSAYYEALSRVEHMGSEFSLVDCQLIAGSFVESGLCDKLLDEEVYRPLFLKDLFSLALEHSEDLQLFTKSKGTGGRNNNYYIPIAALLLAFVILIGSFVYGEKLKRENRNLLLKSHEQETTQEESDDLAVEGSTEKAVDLAGVIAKIKSSAPDALTITGMDYQNGALTIRGETKDAGAVKTWCSQLEELLKNKVEEEPSATVADVVYFQLTVDLGASAANELPEASGTEDTDGDGAGAYGTDDVDIGAQISGTSENI
ncbi:MAG: hypothetical protein SOW18_00750 [Peptoniphilus sp.]|nr:hypothetical protein [Peptoniphilus sp.]MDY3118049.1 hypothetical protein [Peptoniphilus sp.]